MGFVPSKPITPKEREKRKYYPIEMKAVRPGTAGPNVTMSYLTDEEAEWVSNMLHSIHADGSFVNTAVVLYHGDGYTMYCRNKHYDPDLV